MANVKFNKTHRAMLKGVKESFNLSNAKLAKVMGYRTGGSVHKLLSGKQQEIDEARLNDLRIFVQKQRQEEDPSYPVEKLQGRVEALERDFQKSLVMLQDSVSEAHRSINKVDYQGYKTSITTLTASMMSDIRKQGELLRMFVRYGSGAILFAVLISLIALFT